MRSPTHWLLLLLLLAGCSGSDNSQPKEPAPPVIEKTAPLPEPTALDIELRTLAENLGLRGDPTIGLTLPSIHDPLAQLGMQLFFSKALGGDTDVACVSCHHPLLGGGDGLPLPIGTGAEQSNLLGPGRRHAQSAALFDGGPTVSRNAPTLFNVGLWQRLLLHDGHIESLAEGIRTPLTRVGTPDAEAGTDLLAAQAAFPLTNLNEMRGFGFAVTLTRREYLAALFQRLSEQTIPNTWLPLFQATFDADATVDFAHARTALSAYQRSQVFVATPWKAYLQGDLQAIDSAAKRGALLFFREPDAGGAGCARCHRGDFFSDEDFHILAIPQIGRGRGDGPHGDDDFGRFQATGNPAHKHAFRTPTLLNVAVTGPYGHSGAYLELAAVVRHHLDPVRAVAEYDDSLTAISALQPGIQAEHVRANTEAALVSLQQAQNEGRSLLPAPLSVEVDDLVAFLHTLTDPCVTDPACLAAWIPDAPDRDHLRLNKQ